MKLVIILGLILNSLLGWAQENSINEHALFVTHASTLFVTNPSLKMSIDEQVKTFKSRNLPVIYIMSADDETDSNWFTDDRNPTLIIDSSNGDHQVSVKAKEVTVTGGFFTLCFDRTVEAIMDRAERNMIINFPLNGIYEDKALFLSTKLKAKEADSLSSVKGYQTLEFYKKNLSSESFKSGLKPFFKYKKDFSYEVFLKGKVILKNHLPRKKKFRINLI